MNRSGPLGRLASRLVSDRSAQSETIGFMLVIALTLIGVTAVVVFGTGALSDTQTQSELDRAEQQMTLLDSRVSTVALGEADQQSISMASTEGSFAVDPTAGNLTIVHVNYDGSGNNATILPETSMGAVVYRQGGESIAYQGGGVWRSYEGNASAMVSPPEFHYRAATLTFPIIYVRGNGGGGGSGETRLTFHKATRGVPVYPSSTRAYPNSDPYENPVSNGSVKIRVQSEYASAWANYFRSRTEGNVTLTNQDTVEVELITLGSRGVFRMPAETQSLKIRGAESGHSLVDFSFTLRPQDSEESSFNNLHWSFYAEKGDYQMEYVIQQKGGGTNCGNDVALSIYYSDDGGETYHGWKDEDAFTAVCGEYNGKPADGNEIKVDVDLVPANGTHFINYTSLSNEPVHFKAKGSLASSPAFTEHDPDPGTNYSVGGSEDLALITRHYFAMFSPNFDLTVDDQNNAGVSEAASDGYIYYDGSGKVVTYLHVTKNNVTVDVN